MSMSIVDIFGEEKQIEGKICSKCKNFVPLSNYSFNGGSNYLRTECRKCATALTREINKIRLTAPPYPVNHICPICKRNEEECRGEGGKNVKNTWCLDHDHKNGKFRGWICHNCNRALGAFKDNPEMLIQGLLYLVNSDPELFYKTLNYLQKDNNFDDQRLY